MKKHQHFTNTIVCTSLIFTLVACGGSDGNTSKSTAGTSSCTAVKPQCTVSASPSSSASSPLTPGAKVTLTANCSTGVTQSDWFTNATTFASGISVTVNPNQTTGYGLSYSNCTGGGSDGLYVYVGAGGGTNGNPAASTGTVSTSSSGSSSTGQSALQCIKTGTSSRGGVTITNVCNASVAYAFCNLRPGAPNSAAGSLFVCKGSPASISPTGFIYQQGSDTLAPGATQSILGTDDVSNQVSWIVACSSGKGNISGFDTATISTNSKASGFCY